MAGFARGNQNTTKLLNYLKQSSTQYPCLDKKAEREMIEKWRHDRTKLNQLLFMHNIRTVFSMASRYVSKYRDFDTVVQDGMVGLGEAAKRFDLDKNIKFCTYAVIWVKKYMSGYYYTSQFKNIDANTTSLSAPAASASPDDKGSTLENFIQDIIDPAERLSVPDIDAQLAASENSEICESLYGRLEADSSLSATEKAVFAELFSGREKPRDVAEKHGLDMEQVSDIRRKVLSKFKNILAADYGIASYADLAY